MRFKTFLGEQKEKHAVLAFGRMNPPTTGHEVLVNKVKDVAKEVGGSHHIVLSHSQDKAKNPLTAAQKVKHAKRYFSDTNISVATKEKPNFLSQASELHKKGVTHLHMVAGSDRVGEYHKLLHKYNGVKGPHGHFNFKDIKVHSAGERDPDAEGTSGMSASKMRAHASAGEFHHFKKGIPSHVPEHHAKELYNDVRKGMNIKESIDELFEELLVEGVHDKSIFKAVFLGGGPGSGKDFVLSKTLDGQGLTEINSDKALEFLMDKNNLDMRMPESEKEARDVVRNKAKSMTELKQKLAFLGRNGLIINGTGDDAIKIKKIKERLDELGYESSMIMVNTRDDISAARNVERGQRGGRTVPEEIRKDKWDSVQKARPELAKLFGDNYSEFDNSEDLRSARPEVREAKEKELLELYKKTQKFITKAPKTDASKEWIAGELEKKDTQPVPKGETGLQPHPESNAAEEARKLGLQYYGFGRYGQKGKVTYRSVHDKLVQVNRGINEEVEELFNEDLRKWFDPNHPKGGWKRINSKGEAIGPCAREPGEPKPKCMSNEKRAMLSKKERAAAVRTKRKHDSDPERQGKPINVSNFGKGKLSENYQLSDSGALSALLLGNTIDKIDLDADQGVVVEKKKENYIKDEKGGVRVFLLRAAAAKESHIKNGTVYPFKNGYIVKLNEENQNGVSTIPEEFVFNTPTRDERRIAFSQTGTRTTETGVGTSCKTESYADTTETKSTGKITLAKIRASQKNKEIIESIDRGTEPGLSMAGAGEGLGRDMGEKIRKKDGKVTVAEMQGDETTASIGAQKEDELKKVGINLQSFKAKRPIG